MENQSIVIERTFDAKVQDVWNAITDKNEMRKWYFDLEAFKPEVGFQFQFYGQGLKGERYLHLCEILEVVPYQKLKHSWTYQGYDGYSTVTFELFDLGDHQTKLKLTHEGLETFPVHNPDFAKKNFVQGWTELITKLLANYLEER